MVNSSFTIKFMAGLIEAKNIDSGVITLGTFEEI